MFANNVNEQQQPRQQPEWKYWQDRAETVEREWGRREEERRGKENKTLEGLAKDIRGLTEAIDTKAVEDREREHRKEEERQQA